MVANLVEAALRNRVLNLLLDHHFLLQPMTRQEMVHARSSFSLKSLSEF